MSDLVLVVGSLHYDIVISAPGLPQRDETLVGSAWFPKFGGKGGNQAVAAARAGASRMLGAVGEDGFGAFMRAGLEAAHVRCDFVQTVAHPTGLSVAIVNPAGDYGAVIVSGANWVINIDALLDDTLWAGAAVLLLQNEVPETLNLKAAQIARSRGIPVLLNAAPARDLGQGFATLVDILVVNAVEAEMMGAAAVTDLVSAADAARLLAAQYKTVVVTAGGAGLAAHTAEGETFMIPAQAVVVKSTHGAGDVFTGTLAAQRAKGMSLFDSCTLASRAAALHVSGRADLVY